MEIPELLILRHGETQWNEAGRMQGHLDSPLTAKGIKQAQKQREILAPLPPGRFDVISSPQPRALHTAAIALGGMVETITTDPALREIEVGEWSGADRAPLATRYEGLSYYDHAPGGEGFTMLRKRCEGFLAGLKSPSILITHGITSRMLRLIALGQSDAQITHLPGGQGVVFRIYQGQQEKLE